MPIHNSTRSIKRIFCYLLLFICLNSSNLFNLKQNRAITQILSRSEPLDNRRIPRSSGERLQQQQEQFRQRQQQLRQRYKQQIEQNREHRREDIERVRQRNERRREQREERLNEQLIIQPR